MEIRGGAPFFLSRLLSPLTCDTERGGKGDWGSLLLSLTRGGGGACLPSLPLALSDSLTDCATGDAAGLCVGRRAGQAGLGF